MRARRALFTLALAALLGAACAPAPSVSAPSATIGQATASPTPQPVKLSVAFSNITGDNLPLWFAAETGVAKANGLDLDVQSVDGGSRTMAGLLANSYQMAQLGGSEVMSAVAGGEDLVVVGTLAPVYPYLFMARAEIKTAADLKGKKVGISSPGGSADIATRIALRALGLDPDKDVIILPLGSHAQRSAALFAGAIHAAVDDPPNTVELEANGLHSLYDLAARKLPAAQTTLVAKRSFVGANKDTVQRYVDTLVQSIATMKKDRAGTINVLKKFFKSSDEKAMGVAYDFFVNEVYQPYPYATAEQFAEALKELSKTNAKLVGFDVTKILDPSFVRSAEDRKVGAR